MRDLSQFRFSARLIRAIQRSSESLTALGFPHGLTQSRLSKCLHGAPFGVVSRGRVIALAERLGVPADRAMVRL